MQRRTQQVTTLLRVVGVFCQQCCVRLHRLKSLAGFKLYATSANKCQHCCCSMQTDATCSVGPNNVACRWPTMLSPFAWAFTVSGVPKLVNVSIFIIVSISPMVLHKCCYYSLSELQNERCFLMTTYTLFLRTI